jgi:hypothetical protein
MGTIELIENFKCHFRYYILEQKRVPWSSVSISPRFFEISWLTNFQNGTLDSQEQKEEMILETEAKQA